MTHILNNCSTRLLCTISACVISVILYAYKALTVWLSAYRWKCWPLTWEEYETWF